MSIPRYPTDRERRVLLHLLDLVGVAAALVVGILAGAGAIRAPEVSWGILGRYAGWLAGLAFLWFLMAHAFRVYDGDIRASPLRTALQLLKAGLVAGLLFLAVAVGLGDMALEKDVGAAALFLAALVVLPIAGRLLYRLTLGRPPLRRPTLVVGTGPSARKVGEALRAGGRDTYRVLGFLGSAPVEGAAARPLLGSVAEAPELVRELGAATVVDAAEPDSAERGAWWEVADRCVEAGAQVVPMPLLYERLTGRVPLDQLRGDWRALLPLEHAGGRLAARAAKRAMDLVLTSLGLVVMLPLFPVIAAAIYLESPGPIFYTQTRIGRGGEEIDLLKLRSMIPDAEASGKAEWAADDDPRITRVGKILRSTHVDEFPQFVAILKGEMSIIGPRPERPEFIEELEREIPHYRARHALKPGLGGWGLVNQGYGSTREDARVKHEYDLWYLRHQSLSVDLVILARTFVDTLTFRGV